MKIFLLETSLGSGVWHYGTAPPRASTADAVWRIQRLTVVGNDLTVEFADGDAELDNVWDDRGSLSYS
jgi:hypothetical protein